MTDADNILTSQCAAALAELYRAALFDDMIPWWEVHSPDRECGGYYSCLERDGRVYASEKYMWPLGRQVWMLSHLFNRHEPGRAGGSWPSTAPDSSWSTPSQRGGGCTSGSRGRAGPGPVA